MADDKGHPIIWINSTGEPSSREWEINEMTFNLFSKDDRTLLIHVDNPSNHTVSVEGSTESSTERYQTLIWHPKPEVGLNDHYKVYIGELDTDFVIVYPKIKTDQLKVVVSGPKEVLIRRASRPKSTE